MFKYIFVLLVLVVSIVLVVWLRLGSSYFSLEIVNDSELVVDEVRLNGSAVVEPRRVNSILAGQRTHLVVELKRDGSIRFEVLQGLNKGDMEIIKDVSSANLDSRRLTIKPGNHYVISEISDSAG